MVCYIQYWPLAWVMRTKSSKLKHFLKYIEKRQHVLVRFDFDRSETVHTHFSYLFSLKVNNLLVFDTYTLLTLYETMLSLFSKQHLACKYCGRSNIYITYVALVFVRETVVAMTGGETARMPQGTRCKYKNGQTPLLRAHPDESQ